MIGGGATGAGTARDCAIRGLKTLLVERFDFTAGATGRNHGLLHSGARYAVTDPESAAECIKENMILRKIARHCVEDTGGLFITLPDDDLGYQATFVDSCRKAGINAEIIDPDEAIRIEPAVNHRLIGAVKVPDGSIDPFRLTVANVIDARRHGADIMTYNQVVGFVIEQNRVMGVKLRDNKTGEESTVYSDLVINAGGIWGHLIAELAGVRINMFPAKGALLIFGHRINNVVINRCRKPTDADILVPGDTISLIGTTSSRIPYDQIDNMEVTPEEVDILMREGIKIAPSIASFHYGHLNSGETVDNVKKTVLILGTPMETAVDPTEFVQAILPYANNVYNINAELMYVSPKFFARGEYMWKHVTKKRDDQTLFEANLGSIDSWGTLESWQAGNPLGSNSFNGAYVEAGYKIFGPDYKYNSAEGLLGGLNGRSLEIVARYSYTGLNDLVDGEYYSAGRDQYYPNGVIADYPATSLSVGGGNLHSVTIGANYSFNKFVQVMLEYNYNHLDRDKYMSDSNFNCIQGRLMFTF